MHKHQTIYEFAVSAGAFEGCVYRRLKTEIEQDTLSNWVDNLRAAHHYLPVDIVAEIQSSCNQALGRATKSLSAIFNYDFFSRFYAFVLSWLYLVSIYRGFDDKRSAFNRQNR